MRLSICIPFDEIKYTMDKELDDKVTIVERLAAYYMETLDSIRVGRDKRVTITLNGSTSFPLTTGRLTLEHDIIEKLLMVSTLDSMGFTIKGNFLFVNMDISGPCELVTR